MLALLLKFRQTKLEVDDFVSKPNDLGYTPLMIATKNGFFECVQILVNVGKADLNKTNFMGNTAAHIAALNGQLEIITFLAQKNIDLLV